MLRSMTGYGRGQASAGGIRVDVELSSVNRKQLDIRFNLPRPLMGFESRLVEMLQGAISRGQISGGAVVHVSSEARRKGARLDRELAAAYVRELRKTAIRLGLRDDLSAGVLLQLPDVVQHADVEHDSDDLWPVLKRAFAGAVKQLVAMREREGEALGADLARRLGRMAQELEPIRTQAPRVVTRHRVVLMRRLARAGVPVNTADPALLREITVFADRSDISEEVTRLESHLKQARGLLKPREPAGRTLDFLAQEMFREINTIGSKANDVRITRQVIRLKTELERFREQVQNVE